MVNIGIGQHDARDGRLADTIVYAVTRVKFRRGLNLRAQIGRSSEQKPRMPVLTDGNLGLSARLAVECARSQGTAVGTGAIPLGKSAARSRAQDFHTHVKRVYNVE